MRNESLESRVRPLAVACLSLVLGLAMVPSKTVAAASGSIAGVVTDDAGKPLRGAAITARIDNMSVARYTDASGKYEITGLKPGSYKVSAGAYAYGSKTVDQDVSTGTANVAFSLKASWNPTMISSAEYISTFGNDKDAQNVEGTCTPCHNLSWVMRRRGQTAEEWRQFIPKMSTRASIPRMSDDQLMKISLSLEKVFGPDSPIPTQDQVKHVAISDEALHATFRYYTPPTRNLAHSLNVGPDGRVWFSEWDYESNKLGEFNPAKEEFKEYQMSAPKALPHNTWVAKNGMIWLTENGADKLDSIDPATDKLTEYPVPNNAGAHTVKEGPTGDVWIVGRKVSKFDPETKKFDTYDAAGYDVAVDSHNNAWSTDYATGTIDEVDSKAGTTTRHPVPGAVVGTVSLRGIAVDAQDNVWFADLLGPQGHSLAKLDHQTKQITFYKAPTAGLSIYGITIDKKSGNIWVADYLGANLDKFNPTTGKFTEYPFPDRRQMIRFFSLDPQGRVWFTDFTNGRVGVMETDDMKLSAQR